ncbi:hypothetical protein CONPUDRAFT_162339 [Coniophora puteana RWD-64-598 SS2]|uniref:Rab-GAP TBC domain-containing protein n=1 Tax=Coniophora puteana (strain RWD-64-598) TaxID=741705 RepID=A0A5M3N204_CONPW|nr:uncharacterized protein CONPUDRAFT_162339 [Coniophora puteana RWD-64-598 SS2]EIW85044.1 hypothetical protein CONPUDRAFT_162339 [Coniophora puteana RWD-64-598 SS2]
MAGMSAWDSTSVKATLRTAAQRLGQLQSLKDTHGRALRREIADLLQQGDASQARAKAQSLLREEADADLMEILEMHIGVILERFRELEEGKATTPVFIEAAGSIIVAAPSVSLPDFSVVRNILVHRLGHQFARFAIEQQNGHVSPRVLRITSSPSPSAATMNQFLHGIAASHGISWVSEPLREDIRDVLLRILDPVGSHMVDLGQLRHMCGQGIPDNPSWLRPRVWKLFLGNLPASKASWSKDSESQRRSYYDLVQRLLPVVGTSLGDQPSTSHGNLFTFATLLLNLPTHLSSVLVDEPIWLKTSPSSQDTDTDTKDNRAGALNARLISLLHNQSESTDQKVRAEMKRLEKMDLARLDGSSSGNDDIHYAHFSALLRILFVHSCLHPMKPPPCLPSVLVPLYCVFMKEQDPADLAHTEADTFWAFQSLVSEFGELYEQEGSRKWMKTLSEMLTVADKELAEDLHAKGLDPALPHYSYSWIAGLLSQNLPFSSACAVWDVLLSKPMRRRDSSPKLDLLVDICTALLVRAKVPLMCLGKSEHHVSTPWVEEDLARRPPSPLRPWELSDAFSEGMTLLQTYPVETAGGIDSILQTAHDISQRRSDDGKAQNATTLGLGGRLANAMWKGFTNQVSEEGEDSSPEEESEDSSEEEVVEGAEDGNETETPGLTSRLANTVWRGITNQSSMDPVDSPPSPLSPPHSPLASPPPQLEAAKETNPSFSPGLWNYAENLKDSDAAATIAKVSSNWRARAWDVWSSRTSKTSMSEISSPMSTVSELPPTTKASPSLRDHFPHAGRRGSLPDIVDNDLPPRPAFFRLPRDSFLPQPRRGNSSATDNPSNSGAHGSDSLYNMSLASLSSILGNPKSPSPSAGPTANGSGPRPLLLTSHSPITPRTFASANSSSRSTSTTSITQWSNIPIGHSTQASVSSLSSLSPSEAFFISARQSATSRSDRESDLGGNRSKRVLLNRKSVSPMAPAHRALHLQQGSKLSGTTSDTGSTGRLGISSSRTSSIDSGKRWSQGTEQWDSPTSASSPMRPVTPPSNPPPTMNDLVDNSQETRTTISKSMFAASRASLDVGDDTSDSEASKTPSKGTQPRFRRPSKPPTIRTGDSLRSELTKTKTISPSSLNAPDDHDLAALTPRAEEFDSSRPTSPSLTLPQEAIADTPSAGVKSNQEHGHEQPAHPRKALNSSSTQQSDSAAEDGDDEGYDDLLSVYESEEGGD